MQEGQLLMTQADRDRLVTLKKARKKLITQREAAEELELSIRQVKRLLNALKKRGDQAVVHRLRGHSSNRRIEEKIEKQAVKILSAPVYEGFGPTLAAEYLRKRHGIEASKETVRQWMIRGKLWRGKREKVKQVHCWRPRRSRFGDLVQWDTSEHEWLEGRGEKLYLIAMIDDATSRLFARFVRHDSTEENMKLLWSYLEKFGRPVSFYTDKASLFQTAEKRKRDEPGVDKDPVEMPPTQIGRALQELGICWIAAHSPQAKGRVERNFGTAQDRLVKGMRVAGVKTIEHANQYQIGTGDLLDSGSFSPGERTRGKKFRDGARPAGEGHACGRSEDHRARQPISGAGLSGVVGAGVDGRAGPSRRCPSAAGQEPQPGGVIEPCGDATGAERLHLAMGRQVLSDRAPSGREWTARSQRAGGGAPERIAGGALWRTIFASERVRCGGQARSSAPGEVGQDAPCRSAR